LTSKTPLRVTRRAHGHIRRAAEWWDLNRPLVPGAIHEELDHAFSLLRAQPKIGGRATNTRARDVRRLLLERIHYYLYYRLRRGTIEVLGLWHTSRGSGPPF
jgi:plasmid stabilization system protein ParE